MHGLRISIVILFPVLGVLWRMNHCLDSVPHEADQHSRCKHQAQFDNTIYTCKVCWPEDAQHLIIRTLWPRGMTRSLAIRLGHDSRIDHQIGAWFTYWSSDWGTIHILIIRLVQRWKFNFRWRGPPDSSVSSLILVGWCEEGHPATKNLLQLSQG